MSVQVFVGVDKKARDLAEKFERLRLIKRLEKVQSFLAMATNMDYSRYFFDEIELSMA